MLIRSHSLLLCCTQLGSQEQPRALEQDGANSSVQSMSLYITVACCTFANIVFKFFGVDFKPEVHFSGTQDISLIMSQSSCRLRLTDCVHVYVYSFSQSTRTMPTSRRTGLISESTDLRSFVSDTVISVRSLCTILPNTKQTRGAE